MYKEKVKRIQEMIKEYRETEKYIEDEIIQKQTRLDETRKRRGILQEALEDALEPEPMIEAE